MVEVSGIGGVKLMRVFVCEELINDLRVNFEKINDMFGQMNKQNYEAFFVYSFALFESSICEVVRRILAAFPEKLSDEKQPKLKYSDIINNIYSSNYILYSIIEAEIKSISKGDAVALLQKMQKLISIELPFNKNVIDEVSKYRNKLAHDNTVSKRKYILGSGTSNNDSFSLEKAKNLIDVLLNVLSELEQSLKMKYQKYTKYKLIKDLWEEIFKTPLLKFEDCIVIRKSTMDKKNDVVGLNFEHLKRSTRSISSGEKFFLAFLLNQYSGSINDQFFKFGDIPGLVSVTSKTNINKILHVFDIYPNLFNGVHIDGAT
ncbi:hypothetical protein [Paenibacillus sp. NPDC058174]|uniref:hypothetical protein n=1 Tax=Paenibacillus sp. NPDC058174 TaxID=3346366 RepID=UPI0036D7B992